MKSASHLLLSFALLLIAGCSRSGDSEIGAQLIKLAPDQNEQWSRVVSTTSAPPVPFIAKIEFAVRPEFQGKSVDDALALLPKDYPYSFIFFADEQALTTEGFPCICVDLLDAKKPRFRVEAKHIASVEKNLTLANMDFSEFAEAAKAKGVFRGFLPAPRGD